MDLGIDILERVARDPGKAYSLTGIAEDQQRHLATCVEILQTLVARTYPTLCGGTDPKK